jgi:serine phosphatase RsbU (regulator of sigma subunit)
VIGHQSASGGKAVSRRVLRSSGAVFALAIVVETAFLFLVGERSSSRLLLGIPGSAVALIVTLAGTLAGPAIGVGVALIGGLAFFAFIADFGAASSLFGTLVGTAIWCVAAVISGLVAERMRTHRRRHRWVARSLGRESYVREAIDRILAQSLSLEAGDTRAVAAKICSGAREILGSDWVRLYVVEGEWLRLEGGEPYAPLLPVGATFALADFPDELLRSRTPLVVTDAAAVGLPTGLAVAASGLSVSSSIAAPLLVGERLTGFLVCSWIGVIPETDGELVGVAARFADQAGAAFEHARRRDAQAELEELHAVLERSLLPPSRLRHSDLSIISRYRPSEARLRLGGDFLDVMNLPRGGLALIIGDVSGHGPAAAALGATLRAAWQALIVAGADRATIRATLDATIVRERHDEEAFATACLIWIDRTAEGDRLHCLNIGHPLPLLLGGAVKALSARPALPLGVGGEERWEPTIVTLAAPWSLLAYTDGLIEGRAAPGSLERYGEQRLIAHLSRMDTVDGAALDGLLAAVVAANGGPLVDDVALLVVSRPR